MDVKTIASWLIIAGLVLVAAQIAISVVHHHYLRGLLFCQRCHDRDVVSQLVFTEAEGRGGTYEYFFCTRRKTGECTLPYVAIADIERGTRDAVGRERIPREVIVELREGLRRTLETSASTSAALQRDLKRQLKKLEGQEDRIIELVADGDLPTDKLKDQLRAVTLKRAHLRERLERVHTELAVGHENIDAYMDLLTEPGDFFDRSNSLGRQQLLESLYSGLRVDAHDDVEVVGEPHAAVRGLTGIQSVLANEKADPHLSVEARFVRSVVKLTDLIRPKGSNKSSLVAGTGFEPATSGL